MRFSKRFVIRAIAVLAAGGAASAAYSAPEIDYVSGEWKEGSSVTLSGSSFGSLGPTVALYDTFEGISSGAPVRLDNPTYGNWGTGTTGDAKVVNNGGYSGDHSALVSGGILVWGVPGGGQWGHEEFQEVFASAAIRDYGNFPGRGGTPTSFSSDSSTKDLWLMYGSRGYHQQVSGQGNDLYIIGHTGGGAGKIAGNNTKTNWWRHLKDDWAFKDWNRQSVYLRLNPGNPYGPVQQAFVQMVNAKHNSVNSYSGSAMTKKDGVRPYWDRLNFGGWYRDRDAARRVMDDVYVAYGKGAQARVEVCDAPRYSDCKRLGFLIPTDWSASQISAKYVGAPVDGKAYLYVFTSTGDYNRSGYQVHLSGTKQKDGAVPAAPVLLNASN